MRLVVFEPDNFRNFFPLAHLRPTFALRCGALTLYEKIIRNHPGMPVSLFCRDSLAETFSAELDKDTSLNDLSTLDDNLLVINGNLLIGEWMLETAGPEAAGLTEDGRLLYARISRFSASKLPRNNIHEFMTAAAGKLPGREIMDLDLIERPWELIARNSQAIESDYRIADRQGVLGWFHENVTVYGPAGNLYIAPEAEIHPQVVIDTHGGPVTIEKGAVVFPHSRIEGPCYIGPDTQITRGNIRAGCSFGPDCRIGGEVEESIVHGRTNKYHDGFLGHSYVGEWVNIGAQTVTSDLKNDYSEISVFANVSGQDWEFVPTGSMKVGSLIGDHVKTSIGALLNSGSSIGTGAIVMASDGLLRKFIPAFCWLVDNAVTGGFGIEHLVDVARFVVERRGEQFKPAYRDLLLHAYELTSDERAMGRAASVGGCGHGHDDAASGHENATATVRAMLGSLLQIDPDSLEDDDSLQQDLGVESLDRLRIGAMIEDAFGVELEGAGLARAVTVGDLARMVATLLGGG